MIILLLHIVRSGETIRVISDNYQCEISDITSNNLHITDFKNLKPGMKLRIPFLTKPIIETLEETESFIKDYYPNLNEKFDNKVNLEKDDIPEELVVEEKVKEPEEIKVAKPVEKDIHNYPRFGYYSGNVIPEIPSKYIKKI